MSLATYPTNEEILAARTAARDLRTGPRVGDFLRLPRIDPRQPEFTRFTHLWDFDDEEESSMQTGGDRNGSYYLGEGGGLSYSGGLDPGIRLADLVATGETMPGRVWFFDRDIHVAHNGWGGDIPCRIYDLRPGADTSRLHSLSTGLYCTYWPGGSSPNGYTYTVARGGMNHRAFRSLEELQAWAATENYALIPLSDGSYSIDWPAAAPA